MAAGDFELAKELAAELGIEVEGGEAPHLTDIGNALWFVKLHGADLRYSWPTKSFIHWIETHWDTSEGEKAAKWSARAVAHKHYESAASLNTHAAELNTRASTEVDGQESVKLADQAMKANSIAKAYTSWAKKSEARERQNAMIDLARGDSDFTILPHQLDVDPWLLNCLNGTIDLRTGELREHRREDFITKICPVEYEPDATFLLWDDFLERVQPIPEMRQFLRRAAGYTITGLTTEEKLFFSYGDTSTGKSTFLQAILKTLGDYAMTADFDTFLQKDRSSGHTADIARLAGSRLVISVEVDEGKKLAESLIKTITGGEEVTASHKYQDSFSFDPTFQLWLAANHRPRVRSDDAAMWRRILQLPFDVVIPEAERDPGVKDTLKDTTIAGPAILAWLVKGCLEWQADGLNPPEQVRQATEQYREEMDPLAEFIGDRCVVQDGATADNGEIYQEYQKWAATAGIRRPIGRKAFTQGLKSRGFEQESTGKARYWPGLGILADDRLLDS